MFPMGGDSKRMNMLHPFLFFHTLSTAAVSFRTKYYLILYVIPFRKM